MTDRQQLAVDFIPLARRLAKRARVGYSGQYWDDFESDAIYGLVKAAASFDPTRGSFYNHALGAIRWDMVDRKAASIEDGRRHVLFSELSHEPDPAAEAADADDGLEEILRVLPARHAEVFRLMFRDGLGQARAARRLGISYRYAHVQYRWGLEQLRHHFGVTR